MAMVKFGNCPAFDWLIHRQMKGTEKRVEEGRLSRTMLVPQSVLHEYAYVEEEGYKNITTATPQSCHITKPLPPL
jgi:hypothetical protein